MWESEDSVGSLGTGTTTWYEGTERGSSVRASDTLTTEPFLQPPLLVHSFAYACLLKVFILKAENRAQLVQRLPSMYKAMGSIPRKRNISNYAQWCRRGRRSTNSKLTFVPLSVVCDYASMAFSGILIMLQGLNFSTLALRSYHLNYSGFTVRVDLGQDPFLTLFCGTCKLQDSYLSIGTSEPFYQYAFVCCYFYLITLSL